MPTQHQAWAIPDSRPVGYARGYDSGDASQAKTRISPTRSTTVSGVDEFGGMRAVAGVGCGLAPTHQSGVGR